MKIFYTLTLLYLTGFIISCSSDTPVENIPDNPTEVRFTAPDFIKETNSRTNLDITEEGVKFSWASNDTVGIFPEEGAQAYFLMNSGTGTNNAYFSGGGWALKPSTSYSAYYPFHGSFYLNKNKIPLIYTGQCQDGNGSTTHLGNYDYMAAVSTTPENGIVDFKFQHLSALVQMKLPVYGECSLASLVLSCDEPLFITKNSLDLTSNPISLSAINTSDKYEISLKNISFTEGTNLATIYFMLPPVDLSGKTIKIQLYLSENQTPMSGEFTGKDFKAGMAYSYYLQDISYTSSVKAVDLGLSVKWANTNVGSMHPELHGTYYSWGSTQYYNTGFTISTYPWARHVGGNLNIFEYINIGSVISGTQYDVATVNWGGLWRMPTAEEAQELIDKCTWERSADGYQITGPNGNHILLAFDEYNDQLYDPTGTTILWTGTIYPLPDVAPENWSLANNLHIKYDKTTNTIEKMIGGSYRYMGFCVRPVLGNLPLSTNE